MADMKRHVGKITNTDKRCVVVYMQIPGREDRALVVDTDALPDKYHEELMSIVEHEGQKHVNLADILSRRASTHSGTDILNTLHSTGYLMPVPVEQIEMIPFPGRKIPLSQVIEMTGTQKSKWDPSANESPMNEAYDYSSTTDYSQQGEMAEQEGIEDPDPQEAAGRYNRILENQEVGKQEQMLGVARNIIAEAEMLEQEANRKREQAYSMAPSLKPKSKPAPKQTLREDPEQKAAPKAASTSTSKSSKTSKSSGTKRGPGRPKKASS